MKIGFIGLGHMGNPMARNLLKHGHKLKVFDVVPDLVKKLTELGCEAASTPCVQTAGEDAASQPSSVSFLTRSGTTSNTFSM